MDKSPTYLSDASPSGSIGSISSATEAINDFANLSLEDQERQREEWRIELQRVEEEINTLRTVLSSKIHHSTELKRKLGVTVWKEIQEDVSSGIKNMRDSNVIKNSRLSKSYHKTESVLKTTAEKTTSLFSGFSTKINQMKNSESFKSFEDKVGGAYESVKTKVSTSRSGSVQSFNDVTGSNSNTAPSTPIHEEKHV
ncbi:tumor protein D52 isoform X1 [Chironomus tepperi]|uniref:tumor protein D52 isoform X1 n=1 Tax=Chironomus tepperi TaxID=113505 RepID=UPI00391F6CF4